MTRLLELQDVTKVFGRGATTNVAVDHLSLVVDEEPPSFTAIAGESGSGKTTLARMALGLADPTSGHVLYRWKDLRRLSGTERRAYRRQVQAIFQDPFEVFNPFYKVDHLLSTPIALFGLAASRADARNQIEQALHTVGLRPEETLGRHPHQLSGGQRQRLTIARALLLRPRLIIADEPVSMVDASLRATILESLERLHRDFGISFLYITHDLTTAFQVSDTIVILYRGSVAEVGDVDLVIKHPKHPYAQLLVSSIPQPDVNRRWGDEPVTAPRRDKTAGPRGCKFADRCPFVMDVCRQSPPPLFRVDERRAASCFLYRDSPTVERAAVEQMLRRESTSTHVTEVGTPQ